MEPVFTLTLHCQNTSSGGHRNSAQTTLQSHWCRQRNDGASRERTSYALISLVRSSGPAEHTHPPEGMHTNRNTYIIITQPQYSLKTLQNPMELAYFSGLGRMKGEAFPQWPWSLLGTSPTIQGDLERINNSDPLILSGCSEAYKPPTYCPQSINM